MELPKNSKRNGIVHGSVLSALVLYHIAGYLRLMIIRSLLSISNQRGYFNICLSFAFSF